MPCPNRPVLQLLALPEPIEYEAATRLQERLVAERAAALLPDTLILCEHPPVITLGRSFHPENLREAPLDLEARGIRVRPAARGGDVTYHGPGQLVGYPIVELTRRGRDLHAYLRDLEEVLIRLLADYGLVGERVPGRTGVWVHHEKVAAIGVAVRRWVAWHGFALNVSTPVEAFAPIIPCGIRDRGVTSLERLLGRPVPRETLQEALVREMVAAFGYGETVPGDCARWLRLDQAGPGNHSGSPN